MKWFENVTTLDELRQTYKKLLIKYHPDNNPKTDTTPIIQEINVNYDLLLKQLQQNSTSNQYNDFSDDELKNILNDSLIRKYFVIKKRYKTKKFEFFLTPING